MMPDRLSRRGLLPVAGLNAGLVLALLLPVGGVATPMVSGGVTAGSVTAAPTLERSTPAGFSSTTTSTASRPTTTTRVSHRYHRYTARSRATVTVAVTASGTSTVRKTVSEQLTAPDGSVLRGVGSVSATGTATRRVTTKGAATIIRSARTRTAATKAARAVGLRLATSRATAAAKDSAVRAARAAATKEAVENATARARQRARSIVRDALAQWQMRNWGSSPVTATSSANTVPASTPTTANAPLPAAPAETAVRSSAPPLWQLRAASNGTPVADVKSWDCTDGSGRYTSAIADSDHPNAQQFVVGGSGRCEASPSVSFTEGQERWFSFSTYLPTGFPVRTSWQVLAQWKNDGAGSPPLSLVVAGGSDSFAFDGGYGHPDGPKQWQVPVGTVVTGRWVDWKVRVVFSTSPSTAVLEAWRDGVKVISGYHPAGGTLYPARASNGSNPNGASSASSYLKYGIYRATSVTTPTWVGHSNWVVADTAAGLVR